MALQMIDWAIEALESQKLSDATKSARVMKYLLSIQEDVRKLEEKK